MDRRLVLQATVGLAAAALIPGVALASPGNPVFVLPLPFVRSYGMCREVYLGGVRDIGEYYSLIPRTKQLQDVVDEALATFHDQLVSLHLTLLDAAGNAIGPSCVYEDAFLRGPALGWFGAGQTLRKAGLFKHEAGLDHIRKVRVEVVPLTAPLVGEVVKQRRLHDKALQKEGGKVTIFGDGTFAGDGLDAGSYYAMMDQIQMVKADPDFKIFTSHQVVNYAEDLKGRFVSMVGASSRVLAEARETHERGDSIVWDNEIQFC